jgi:prepilin-type N-terminal cleavage/methylation domain-containing protein
MEIIRTKFNTLGRQAFTLVELLVAVAIVVGLATILVPAAKSVYASSTDAVSAHVIAQLNAAAQSYLAENNQIFWPYRSAAAGGTQWWFGFESTASLQSSEGNRWLDLTQGRSDRTSRHPAAWQRTLPSQDREMFLNQSMGRRILPTATICCSPGKIS